MVYLSTEAAVRMAKADDAFNIAVREYAKGGREGKRGSELKPYFDAWQAAATEKAAAVAAVVVELRAQNLHNMTDPA